MKNPAYYTISSLKEWSRLELNSGPAESAVLSAHLFGASDRVSFNKKVYRRISCKPLVYAQVRP